MAFDMHFSSKAAPFMQHLQEQTNAALANVNQEVVSKGYGYISYEVTTTAVNSGHCSSVRLQVFVQMNDGDYYDYNDPQRSTISRTIIDVSENDTNIYGVFRGYRGGEFDDEDMLAMQTYIDVFRRNLDEVINDIRNLPGKSERQVLKMQKVLREAQEIGANFDPDNELAQIFVAKIDDLLNQCGDLKLTYRVSAE